MLSKVDSEGRRFQILKEICDHRSGWRAIPKRFRFTVSNNGNKTQKSTTVGWKLQFEWKDVSMKWLSLKYIKAPYLLNLSDCAFANNIH